MSRLRPAGFGLLEVAVSLGVLAVLALAVVVSVSGRVDQARVEQTVREATAIANAALMYRERTASWPESMSDLLASGDLAGSPSGVNPFGSPYALITGAKVVTVTTTVPAASVPQVSGDLEVTTTVDGESHIRVSRVLAEAGTSEWIYDKQNLYQVSSP